MIAFCGLGRMGGVLAERLRSAGVEMRVYDAAASVRQAFRERAFDVRESLAEAASSAESVWLCLPSSSDVRVAVMGPGGLLGAQPHPGLVVDLTSGRPSATREIGIALAARGVRMLDAPVSGGVAGARAGQLTVMVGGDPRLMESVGALFGAFASRVVWAGELGAGHAVKAVNNALSAVSLAVTSEMLSASVAHGIQPEVAMAAINAGSARSQNSEVKFIQHILPGSFNAGFTAGLMHKDIGTACQIGMERGVALPLTAVVQEVWAALVARFGRSADFTRIYELSQEWTGSQPESQKEGKGNDHHH